MAKPAKNASKKSLSVPKLSTVIDDLSAGLTLLIQRPVKDLRKVVLRDQRRLSRGPHRWKTLLGLPVTIGVSLISLVGKVLLAPFELWTAVFQKRKLKRSVLIALSPLACLALGWSFWASFQHFQNREILSLRSQAKAAITSEDFSMAVKCYDQLSQKQATMSPEDKFRYARSLANIGKTEAAESLIRELAPAPGLQRGYAPAHQFMAISIVRSSSTLTAPQQNLLKWHLDAGGNHPYIGAVDVVTKEDTGKKESLPAIDRLQLATDSERHFFAEYSHARARYFESVKQYRPAIEPMRVSAQTQPERNLALADIARRAGDRRTEAAALHAAAEYLQQRLQEDPQQHLARISLAKVLVRLGQPETAKQQLVLGHQLNPAVFSPQLGQYHLDRWRALPQSTGTQQRLEPLSMALSYAPNNVAVFEALVATYRQLEPTPDQRQRVWQILEDTSQVDPQAAMPHFAMGILHRLEQRPDQSRQQIEAAFELLDPDQPGFAVIANNLAWLIMQDQQSDLEVAERLAGLAVRRYPNSGGIRDTLATVLMKRGAYERAVAEFQRALPGVRDKAAVHQKMAKIYQVLDQPQLSEMHRARAAAH